MTDISEVPAKRMPAGGPVSNATPGSTHDPRLVSMVELLFFAYRDFTAEPDAILDEMGFGRAHHRVLHFVNRNPGLRVADLLGILRITKQSLARVLKQLVDDGFIIQTAGPNDRRERRLEPTERGCLLAERLLANQTKRIAVALAEAGVTIGADASRPAEAFLLGMISPEDRGALEAAIDSRGERSRPERRRSR